LTYKVIREAYNLIWSMATNESAKYSRYTNSCNEFVQSSLLSDNTTVC